MRFLRQSLTGLFLLAATLGLLLWAGTMVRDAVQARLSEGDFRPQNRERLLAVNVLSATPETLTPVLTAFGEVQSRRTLEVRAAVGGQVIELAGNFEDGAEVQQDDLLVRIDPANARDALARSEADLRDASADADEAVAALALARDELAAAQEQADLRQRAFERQRDLNARGVGTAAAEESAELAASSARQAVLTRRQAVSQAEARVTQSTTSLERVRIALSEAQRRLDDTEIRAGFTGTLSDVSVVEGGLVSVNERLAQLVDAEALEVAFRVPVEAYARLLDEQGRLIEAPVSVTLDVLGVDLVNQGTLVRASAAVGEGQTGRLLFAKLDEVRGLKPGDFVTVQADEPELSGVIRLPARALGADGAVLVLGDDDRLEEVPVTMLRRQGNDVLVRSRALAGREVVAERTPLLGAGIKVRPLRSDGAEAPAAPAMVELSEERRAKIRAFVEANKRMPAAAKARILGQLDQPKVPAAMIERIESRMGS